MKVFAALGRVVGVGVLLAVPPLVAHHSFSAEFDADKTVTLKGTITKMEWVNPHSWLHIDVKGPDGTVVSWAIEFGLPKVCTGVVGGRVTCRSGQRSPSRDIWPRTVPQPQTRVT